MRVINCGKNKMKVYMKKTGYALFLLVIYSSVELVKNGRRRSVTRREKGPTTAKNLKVS
jgi:hypothetical protein